MAIAPQIEEDRDTLVDLMERLDTSKNLVKQATTWVAEKASRVKFGGASSGEADHGAFMALETLTLGVEGKASLWIALEEVADRYPALQATDLDHPWREPVSSVTCGSGSGCTRGGGRWGTTEHRTSRTGRAAPRGAPRTRAVSAW